MTVSALPLFQAARDISPQLGRHVTEVPQKTAEAEKRKAILYNLAAKVCLAAFVAIALGAIAISLGLIAPLPTALIVALLLSTFPLQIGGQKFMTRSITCQHNANEAREKSLELAQIQHWQTPQIRKFFEEHKISLKDSPLHLLSQIDCKEPLRALLPAIASYRHLRKQTELLYKKHEENLSNRNPDPNLRLAGRRLGWQVLEFQTFPMALRAAFALQTIANPTLQQEVFDKIGICQAKEFDERRFGQLLDDKNEYFIFRTEQPSITFEEMHSMVSKMDLNALRQRLFTLNG